MRLFSKKPESSQQVRFELCGPSLQLHANGLAVRCLSHPETWRGWQGAFALAGPALRSGTASVAFRPTFQGASSVPSGFIKSRVHSYLIGVFPADLKLDSDFESAYSSKCCALHVGTCADSYAHMICDGVSADAMFIPFKVKGFPRMDPRDREIGGPRGIRVGVAFAGDTARVTIICRGEYGRGFRTEERVIEGVPACGLRFGVRLEHKGDSVMLVASTIDAGEGIDPGHPGSSEEKDKLLALRSAEFAVAEKEAGTPPAVRFEGDVGPGIQLLKGGLAVYQTRDKPSPRGNAYALAGPVLHGGAASATFRLDYKGSFEYVLGVFPVDLELDSRLFPAQHNQHNDNPPGRRARLYLGTNGNNRNKSAGVECDGTVDSGHGGEHRLQCQPGDTVEVDVAFAGDAARVTFRVRSRLHLPSVGHHFGEPEDTKSFTASCTLQGVPACGLRFGVGLSRVGSGVTLLASSVDAGAGIDPGSSERAQDRLGAASSSASAGEAPLPVVVGEPLGDESALMGTPVGEPSDGGAAAVRILVTTGEELSAQPAARGT